PDPLLSSWMSSSPAYTLQDFPVLAHLASEHTTGPSLTQTPGLRFTGVIGGAVLRLVRNLVAWRRRLDIPGWFSMRSIERQTFEQSNDWFPAFEETYGDRIGCRSSADTSSRTKQSGCHCRTFPAEPVQPCSQRNDCDEPPKEPVSRLRTRLFPLRVAWISATTPVNGYSY